MADAPVPLVEPTRIHPVESVHPAGERRPRNLDDKVIVVRHQAVHVAGPSVRLGGLPEDREEAGAIAVVEEDRSTQHTACPDMQGGSRRLKAWWPSHRATVVRPFDEIDGRCVLAQTRGASAMS